MNKTVLTVFCALFLNVAVGFQVRAEGDGIPALADSLPDGALAFVEFSKLGEVVRRVEGSELLPWATGSDAYRHFMETPDYENLNKARQLAELMIGGPLWKSAADLLDGEIAMGLYPNPADAKKPHPVALVRFPPSWAHTRLWAAMRLGLALAGEKFDTASRCEGSHSWSVDGKLFVSFHREWYLVSSERALFDRALEALGSQEKSGTLATQPGMAEMRSALGTGHHARLYLNTALVSQGLGERFGMPRKFENGAASLLFAGLVELAAKSPFAGATLDFRDDKFELVTATAGDGTGLPEPYGLYFSKAPESGVIALPQTEGMIAGLTIHRKFGQWYRERDELLAEHLLPAFDKFETDIGNLLPQKDFGADVLPLLGDNFTLVAARQSYDHLEGAPGVKLPAFAAIFDLAKPQEGADIFQLFFQTLSSVLNIQAGQEGRQPWLMEVEFHQETKISYGRYLEKPKGERLPIIFNFQPAAAGVGRKYILATSVQLCRDLVDHFKNPASSEWQPRNVDFQLDFANLAALGGANEGFLRSQEIEKGTPPEVAARNIAMLMELLGRFDLLRYHAASEGGFHKLHLAGSWKQTTPKP